MKVFKFYAQWCSPCKSLTEIIKGAGDKITMTIDEVDIDDNIFMAQQWAIRSVPTMVIVDDAEKEIKRHVGLMNETQLLEFLKV
jgi:thioredoxin 1